MDEKMKELETTLSEIKAENDKLKGELAAANERVVKFEADTKLAEQKGKFDKMLSEGKVCEAQREPYMKGDFAKFSELSQPLHTAPAGNGGGSGAGGDKGGSAQDEVIKLAEKKLIEKSVKTLSDGIQVVLRENAELHKRYRAEVGG